MPTQDIYKQLYNRNVLGIDPSRVSSIPKETDYTEEMRKKALEYKQQGKTRQETETMLRSQYGNKVSAPTKRESPIPNIKNMLQTRNAPIIQQQKQSQQQQPTYTPPKPIEPPKFQQTTPGLQGSQPTNKGFELGQQAMQQQLQVGSQQQQQIIQDYNDDIAMIRLEEDQVKSRYKNADQVLAGIRGVESAYKRGITDPQQIAAQTGIPRDQVERVLRGEAFKDLELQDRATEDQRREQEQQMQDLRTTRNRQEDQLAQRAERLEYDHNNTVDDIIRQAGLQIAQGKKMGALTGAINSTGYLTALENIRDDANRNIARLKKVVGWEKSDIANARQNLLEDFETNTIRIKQYFDSGMDQLRGNGLAAIQNIQQKYGVATDNATKALRTLYNNMEQQKANLLRETMDMQTSMNNRWRQEIDILEKYANAEDMKQAYLDAYGENPALANALYPEIGQQIERQQAIARYGSTPAVRNFNPGNIMDTGFGGRDDPNERFTVFDTPQEGFEALVNKIKFMQSGQSKTYSPDMSLYEYFAKYAPDSDGNNSRAYAEDVARKLGVPADGFGVGGLDPVAFAAVIASHEDRQSFQMLQDLGIITSDYKRGQPRTTQTGTQEVSAEVKAYAESIMNPASTQTLDQLPAAIRGEVSTYLSQLQAEARGDGNTVGMMLASAGGDKPEQAVVTGLTKAFTVINQLGVLEQKISKKKGTITDAVTGEVIDISPLTGWIRKRNPWDTDAQEITALLTSMTPMLARGIYGEVGVLTDNDIRLYQQTIPTLSQTSDVKKAVLGLTLRTVRNGIKDQIEINAGLGRDMSGLVNKYLALEAKISEIESSIGVGGATQSQGYGVAFGSIEELPGISDGSYVPFSQ